MIEGMNQSNCAKQIFRHNDLRHLEQLPLVALTGADYATVRSYLGNPLVAIPMLLLVLSGTWHMRIGMQVILDDYIHNEGPKVVSLALNNFFSVVVAIAGAYAVLKMAIQS